MWIVSWTNCGQLVYEEDLLTLATEILLKIIVTPINLISMDMKALQRKCWIPNMHAFIFFFGESTSISVLTLFVNEKMKWN